MKISVVIDKNNIITSYATLGGIEGGVNINVEEIPKDLWRKYYKLTDGKIVVDEELKAQIEATQ